MLALLQAEPGADRVLSILADSVISAVNAAEVLRVLTRTGVSGADARRAFARLHLTVIPFGEADLSFLLDVSTAAPSLSLGDCACLALGLRLDATVFTTDRAWASIKLRIPVKLIREPRRS